MPPISRGRWVIAGTFLVALMLDVLPLPGWATWLRPQWTLLVLIYWAMALPYAVGVFSAFTVGLLLDLLYGTIFGEHALAMVLIAFVVVKSNQLIRVYPVLQQTMIVGFLVLIYQITVYFIQGVIGHLPHTGLYWVTILISSLLWPWVFVLLRDVRRRFFIS